MMRVSLVIVIACMLPIGILAEEVDIGSRERLQLANALRKRVAFAAPFKSTQEFRAVHLYKLDGQSEWALCGQIGWKPPGARWIRFRDFVVNTGSLVMIGDDFSPGEMYATQLSLCK